MNANLTVPTSNPSSFAAPATFRSVYSHLEQAGTAEQHPWALPVAALIGLLVLLFLIAAARHELAGWLHKTFRRGKGGPPPAPADVAAQPPETKPDPPV